MTTRRTSTEQVSTRPEYSAVAVWRDLLDLADQLHDLADRLGATPRGIHVRLAAQNTARAADLVQAGRWDSDAGVAWIISARRLLVMFNG